MHYWCEWYVDQDENMILSQHAYMAHSMAHRKSEVKAR